MSLILSIQDNMDFINELEERFPVDKWIVDSFHIWPLLRIDLAFSLINQLLRNNIQSSSSIPFAGTMRNAYSFMESLCSYSRAYSVDSANNARPAGKVDTVILGAQRSRVLLNGVWYDRLMGPLFDELRDMGKKIFWMNYQHIYRVPRSSPTMFVQPHLDFTVFKTRYQHLRKPLSLKACERFDEFQRFLKTNGCGFACSDAQHIQKYIARIRCIADFFKDIFLKTKPSLAFLVNYNGYHGLAFNLACRESGIVSIEIPHGNHGTLNPFYDRWMKVPEAGYELLPSCFWCWGESEASAINGWNGQLQIHKPIIGGNPWLDIWRTGKTGFVTSFDDKIEELKKAAGASLHVLTTYEFDYDQLIEVIRKSPLSWHWWIRIHPRWIKDKEIIRKKISACGIRNYNIDYATDFPLYALLRNLDIHISEYSSTIIEAAEFGVPTVITRENAAQVYGNQASSGWAVTAHSAENIVHALLYQYERKADLPSQRSHQRNIREILDSLFRMPHGHC